MMRKIIVIVLFTLTLFAIIPEKVPLGADHELKSRITLKIKSSPDAHFQTKLMIHSPELTKTILHAESEETREPLPVSDLYVTLTHATATSNYIVNQHGQLVDPGSGKRLLLPESVEKQLLSYAGLLREKHYGELVSWKKMKTSLPKKAKFEVIDLETGQHFQVQRRAGDLHADVQPLTREDTQAMKEIYEGKWSWKRRAILVKTGSKLIAASMHGMPHGAGAIQNGFPGHFCIHFYQSSTHRSEHVDPTHELMVFKSAGQLEDYFETASPYEMIDAFLVAVNQQDTHLLQMTLTRENDEVTGKLLEELSKIEAIRITRPLKKKKLTNQIAVEVSVDLSLYRQGSGDGNLTVPFIVRRNSPGERWRIESDSLIDLSNQEN